MFFASDCFCNMIKVWFINEPAIAAFLYGSKARKKNNNSNKNNKKPEKTPAEIDLYRKMHTDLRSTSFYPRSPPKSRFFYKKTLLYHAVKIQMHLFYTFVTQITTYLKNKFLKFFAVTCIVAGNV